MTERIGEAFEFDETLTVVGSQLQPGEKAPEFALDYFDPDASTVHSTLHLANSNGKVRLLNVINSIDTPVCHKETLYWEEKLADFGDKVVLYTISTDLPFAQMRWLEAQGGSHQALSDHRTAQFGKDYGVLLKEWRMLQRAIFIIDQNNKLAHVEYVSNQMDEPDYQTALEALKQTVN